jgi:hypothetical protein
VVNAPFYTAESGNVELMAWVLQLPGARLGRHVMEAAAVTGSVAMCKYLHEQQCPWNEGATHIAAINGHVHLLRCLVDNDCPWDAYDLCLAAAEGGSVEVLTYLQQQGMLTDAEMMTLLLDVAAHYNKLAAAMWLREQGAEWPTTFQYRPWSGEVLEWATAEGFIAPNN